MLSPSLPGAPPATAPPRIRTPQLVGLVVATAAALLYAVGWTRAFSFDASRTVAHFVTAPSLADVFGQDRFNNHPLLSFLDHLVYRLTGSQDERLLCVVPILCGAAAVGLVAAAVARRFGAAAGYVAGATMAVNAMALRQFREVRGYSLVVLAAVVSTLLLLRLLRRDDGDRPALLVGGYGAALFAAAATHLFALGLVPVHALVVAGRGRIRGSGHADRPLRSGHAGRPLRSGHAGRLDRRWWRWWAVPVVAGLIVQLPALTDGLGRPPTYQLAPLFPARLAANLLGGPAALGMLVLVVAGWPVFRDRREVRWAVVGTAALVGGAWLAGPSWLDSRFFIWLIPVTSVLAGAAVSRRPRLAPVAVACILANLAVLGPGLARDEVPNRTGAEFVRHSQDAGEYVCALGRTRAGLLAYVVDARVLWNLNHLPSCDIAVEAAGPREQPLIDPACRRFRFVLELPARSPGAVFADRPLPLVPGLPHDAAWERTSTAALCGSG